MFLVFCLKSPHTPQGFAHHTSGNTAVICTRWTRSAFSKCSIKSKLDSSEMMTCDHPLLPPECCPNIQARVLLTPRDHGGGRSISVCSPRYGPADPLITLNTATFIPSVTSDLWPSQMLSLLFDLARKPSTCSLPEVFQIGSLVSFLKHVSLGRPNFLYLNYYGYGSLSISRSVFPILR